MSPTIRTLLTSLMIAAVAPIGLAALDLEQAAYAGNGNGNGGGNGGGHGGGNGGGHGKSSEDHGNAKGQAKTSDVAATDGEETEGEGLAPNELGKLNGVLHASPNAIAHASESSPIGTAREFGEALAGFLDSAETPEEGEAPAEGEETADEDTAPTIDELGEMMARMTNKPVTADQVQAVAEKVGIETTDEAPTDEDTTGEETAEGTTEDPAAGDEPPALDQATAQGIADKANEIHGFDTGDDTGDDATDDGDTADAGDTDDETVTN
jgi:hypothetical protein